MGKVWVHKPACCGIDNFAFVSKTNSVVRSRVRALLCYERIHICQLNSVRHRREEVRWEIHWAGREIGGFGLLDQPKLLGIR